jgi:hypothetical protein
MASRAPEFIRARVHALARSRREQPSRHSSGHAAVRTAVDRRSDALTGGRIVLSTIIEARVLVALTLAAAPGLWGRQTYPVERAGGFLGFIADKRHTRPGYWRTSTRRSGSSRRTSQRRS